MDLQTIQSKIRDIPDFPKPGITFKDITPLLQDPLAFHVSIEKLAAALEPYAVDAIVGIESRGFIFGPAVAFRMKKGFIPLRKKGKLPFKTEQVSYALEYGEATLEIHSDGVVQGQRVAIIDDVLATGGTAFAACQLVERVGGHVVAFAFLGELGFLEGRSKISSYPAFSLLQF
ncbi:MAG TPA: adenine phosphoribosyltransferase [Candidatus Omnitrophica bacterium]|nr:adenine phosphoribosyltransferase [Candidatus Omnitrophota bacterium]